ncbi:hypothetical protein FEM03_23395 [Phragmitibacter flavus]|uniref:Uncharacterized protein n=2 Tax=Phragmitibacter flavus TaxID=2576071 RepID=A0A5R8K7C3_9BACT|nr:hypothetical protein FEM03_23395 [Phragmitibacter flavus]
MSTFTKSLFASLTIVLIIGAQLFGMSAGFICECHDEPLITAAAHCHGESHSHADSCDSEEDAHNHPVTEHEPNEADLQVSTIAHAPAAPVPFVAILSVDAMKFISAHPPIPSSPPLRFDRPPIPPSNAQLVTHCMVILV